MSLSGAESTDRLELASYTRRDDGGTKASYLDPRDRSKSLIEIWIPFSSEASDETDAKSSFTKRTTTLPHKIKMINGGDEDQKRERHQSEPQYTTTSIPPMGNDDSAIDLDDPSYYGNVGTLRSQSSWKSGVTTPHSLSSTLLRQGSVMTNPYDRYAVDDEKEEKKRRCYPWLLCCLVLFILAAVAVTLAVLLTTILKPESASEKLAGADPTSVGIVATNQTLDGNWSVWGEWGSCNQPCSGGEAFRRRLCDNPAPSNGGRDCGGSNEEMQLCNTEPCPPDVINGSWGEWGGWARCSASCGQGHQVRKRLCNNPEPVDGRNCDGINEEARECNIQECNAKRYNVTGRVIDATSKEGEGISGATVSFAGRTTSSNDEGVFFFSNIPAAMYTLVASAEGFTLNTKSILVGDDLTFEDASILLSENLVEGFRVVLAWGREPKDLDLYVLTPEGCRTYYNKHNCDGLNSSKTQLDVDVFEGFGPETITLRKPRFGEAYLVYAAIFSRSAQLVDSFVDSNANIQLYDNSGLLETIPIPTSGYDKFDGYWYALNITPQENGEKPFEIINNVRKTEPKEREYPPPTTPTPTDAQNLPI